MATKEITLYAKKRNTKDGRVFYSYLTTLTKKDGTPCTCAVRFVTPAVAPEASDCPMNIMIDKADCNMAVEKYTNEKTGEVRDSFRLWVRKYEQGSPYVDHSMDDFI